MQPTLTEILKRYPGTDKGTLHSYDEVYEKLFAPLRLRATAILEIGCRDGSSLKAWKDYFPNAVIYGIDNGSENGLWISDDKRIHVLEADTTKPETVTAVLNQFSHGYFDLIIDDGLHRAFSQAVTYGTLKPYLAKDGVYVIEDLEHYEEAVKLQTVIGGVLEDRRKVKNRHDDVLLYFQN